MSDDAKSRPAETRAWAKAQRAETNAAVRSGRAHANTELNDALAKNKAELDGVKSDMAEARAELREHVAFELERAARKEARGGEG
ncbi:hypothetical protein [Humibacter ginsengisoli]